MTSSRGQAGAQSDYAAEYERETGYPPDARQAQYAADQGRGAGAMAGSVLAGVLMIIGGAIGFLDGLAMINRGSFFFYHNGYYYHGSTYSWGWAAVVLGALVFVAGIGVLFGMVWARVIGVIVASLSAVSHFLILPYYPLWSIVLIAVDVFIIWALIARRRYA